jgi:hypothetical protein
LAIDKGVKMERNATVATVRQKILHQLWDSYSDEKKRCAGESQYVWLNETGGWQEDEEYEDDDTDPHRSIALVRGKDGEFNLMSEIPQTGTPFRGYGVNWVVPFTKMLAKAVGLREQPRVAHRMILFSGRKPLTQDWDQQTTLWRCGLLPQQCNARPTVPQSTVGHFLSGRIPGRLGNMDKRKITIEKSATILINVGNFENVTIVESLKADVEYGDMTELKQKDANMQMALDILLKASAERTLKDVNRTRVVGNQPAELW